MCIRDSLCSLFACIKVLGTGIQSIHHQLVGVGIFQVNHDHTPVSYTHLDVYKRQAVNISAMTAEQRDAALALDVERLLRFGRKHKLIKELDAIVARNTCLLYTSRCV